MDQNQVSCAPEHYNDEGDDVEAGQGFGQTLVIVGEPAAACAIQAKLRPTTRRRGGSTRPRFASGSLTTSKAMPCAWPASAGRSPV